MLEDQHRRLVKVTVACFSYAGTLCARSARSRSRSDEVIYYSIKYNLRGIAMTCSSPAFLAVRSGRSQPSQAE